LGTALLYARKSRQRFATWVLSFPVVALFRKKFRLKSGKQLAS